MTRKGAEISEEVREFVKEYGKRFGEGEESGAKRNVFGIEASAKERARAVELECIRAEIEKLDRGFEGNTRQCPKCGKTTQRYKGDEPRKYCFESGKLKVERAHYVCCFCKFSSYPLDDKLGIVSGEEQGCIREKLTMLGTIVAYNQAPQVCKTLLGSEEHAAVLRRLLLKEADRIPETEGKELQTTGEDTLYLEIDGHLCPTREPRVDAEDKGFREAKVVMAFRANDAAQVSKDRVEILDQLIEGKICSADDFRSVVADIHRRSNAANAKALVVLADGAKWIWNIADELMPEAVQILDFSHLKSYLYKAAGLIYFTGSDLIKPWVKQQEDLLFEDKVSDVLNNIRQYLDLSPQLATILQYLENNQSRIRYGYFRQRGFYIGSGAVESAGKRLAQGRIKGSGMHWNICDLNKVINMRCRFFENSWDSMWDAQRKLAA